MACKVFFFSSRRRHTRWPRDWSSDVCSSDLETCGPMIPEGEWIAGAVRLKETRAVLSSVGEMMRVSRSEERRVGKECRSGGEPDAGKKKGRLYSGVARRAQCSSNTANVLDL